MATWYLVHHLPTGINVQIHRDPGPDVHTHRGDDMTTAAGSPGEHPIPGGHGTAFPITRGQYLEIVDVEGQQVADFVAFAAQDRREWASTSHTRSATLRLSLEIGDILESNWRRPMFRIARDDVGSHDVITQMCDDRRYRLDYGIEGHRSCRTNL